MIITIPAYQSLERIIESAIGPYTDTQWAAIIQANGLTWPFLVDGTESTHFPATGTAQITWSGTTPQTIPAGTTITGPVLTTLQVRSYTTDTALTFSAPGTLSVGITCTVPGPWGNAPPQSLFTIPAFPSAAVTNSEPITGGIVYHVKRPGDTLWIPEALLPNQTPIALEQQLAYAVAVGETDIAVTPEGGFQWGDQDLQQVQNAACILQDAAARLRTPVGSLPWAPSVGSLIPAFIGQPSGHKAQRLAAHAIQAVLQDPRLAQARASVQPLDTPGWYLVTIEVVLKGQPTPLQFSLSMTL